MPTRPREIYQVLPYTKVIYFIQENAFENVVWEIGGQFVSASMC